MHINGTNLHSRSERTGTNTSERTGDKLELEEDRYFDDIGNKRCSNGQDRF
jgi:hypothetical protein